MWGLRCVVVVVVEGVAVATTFECTGCVCVHTVVYGTHEREGVGSVHISLRLYVVWFKYVWLDAALYGCASVCNGVCPYV